MIVRSDSEYLAVVPARAGSKRIPGKNLRVVAGKPLLCWSIEHASRARRALRVVVSTDDEAIAEIARRSGAEVPTLRPAELAGDEARSEPVLLHALDTLPGSDAIRHVVMLQATSPVRDEGSLDAAIELYEHSGADSLVSVSPVNPLLWRGGAETAQPLYDIEDRPRQQCVDEERARYVENGSITITSVAGLRAKGNRLCGRIAMYVMTAHEGIDVDTPYDLWLASRYLEDHHAR